MLPLEDFVCLATLDATGASAFKEFPLVQDVVVVLDTVANDENEALLWNTATSNLVIQTIDDRT